MSLLQSVFLMVRWCNSGHLSFTNTARCPHPPYLISAVLGQPGLDADKHGLSYFLVLVWLIGLIRCPLMPGPPIHPWYCEEISHSTWWWVFSGFDAWYQIPPKILGQLWTRTESSSCQGWFRILTISSWYLSTSHKLRLQFHQRRDVPFPNSQPWYLETGPPPSCRAFAFEHCLSHNVSNAYSAFLP